jgi:hypothetical protein
MFVLAGLVGALVAVPIAVYASHSFNDVPGSNTFHSDIAWLADAGITKGCNPPDNTEYCPKDEVTREQMAAFMRRLAENQVVDAATVDGLDSTELGTPDCSPGYVFATAEIDVRQVSTTDFTPNGVFGSYTCNGRELLAKKSASGTRIQVALEDSNPNDDTIGSDSQNTIAFSVADDVAFPAATGLNQCAISPPPFVLCWTFDFQDDSGPYAPVAIIYMTVHRTS